MFGFSLAFDDLSLIGDDLGLDESDQDTTLVICQIPLQTHHDIFEDILIIVLTEMVRLAFYESLCRDFVDIIACRQQRIEGLLVLERGRVILAFAGLLLRFVGWWGNNWSY